MNQATTDRGTQLGIDFGSLVGRAADYKKLRAAFETALAPVVDHAN